jgi:acyl-CoA thioesterase
LFLGVGSFDDVDIEVTSIRMGKRAEAMRVRIDQGGRALLEGHVWAIEEGLSGLEHDLAIPPDVPGPDTLKSMAELMPEESPARFWGNFEVKPVAWIPPEDWPPPPPVEPAVRQWMRFNPVARYESDPWIDACRAVVLLDTFQWPAASRAHMHRDASEPAYIAPNMNLSVQFHRAAPASAWLLVDAYGPLAESGLMAGEARVWSESRQLVASAASQLLCREVPRGTPGSGTVST